MLFKKKVGALEITLSNWNVYSSSTILLVLILNAHAFVKVTHYSMVSQGKLVFDWPQGFEDCWKRSVSFLQYSCLLVPKTGGVEDRNLC